MRKLPLSNLGPPAAALAGLVAALLFSRGEGLPLDDAYIHQVFARNLSRGEGFVFNPGEFSLGFSSLSWIVLLSLLHRLHLDPITGVKVLGALFFSLSLFLLGRLIRLSISFLEERTLSPFPATEPPSSSGRWYAAGFSLGAAFGLALCGNLLWLAGSGMEAMMYLFLGLAAISLFTAEKPRPMSAAPVFALLLLTRPTALALLFLLALLALLRSETRRPRLLSLAAGLLLAGPWFAYTFFQTSSLLPPTHAGKLASNLFNSGLALQGIKTFLLRHLHYLYVADRGVWFLLLFGLAAVLAGALISLRLPSPSAGDERSAYRLFSLVSLRQRAESLSPSGLFVLWTLAELGLYALFFRSTYAITPYHNLRYLPMLLPAVAAGAASALAACAFRLSAVSPSPPSSAARAGIPLSWLFALVFFLAPFSLEVLKLPSWRNLYLRNLDHLQHLHRAAAEWTRDHTPSDARLACLDIGILGYYSERYIIDLGGLIDPGIHPLLQDHRTGPWLLQKQADYYLEMTRHPSEKITGVKADEGRLYSLRHSGGFNYPSYQAPVLLHSLGIEIYEVQPLP